MRKLPEKHPWPCETCRWREPVQVEQHDRESRTIAYRQANICNWTPAGEALYPPWFQPGSTLCETSTIYCDAWSPKETT